MILSAISWPLITDLFIVAMIVVALAYEAIVVIASGYSDSISWEIWQAVKKRPFIAFLAGFLCGHLFRQMVP